MHVWGEMNREVNALLIHAAGLERLPVHTHVQLIVAMNVHQDFSRLVNITFAASQQRRKIGRRTAQTLTWPSTTAWSWQPMAQQMCVKL